MADSKDTFLYPITLEYIQLNYGEVAKTLFIDYGFMDETTRAIAALEFLKHFFFNTSEDEIELFRKRNPQAGMIFDMLDKASEGRQVRARKESWKNFYECDDTKSIEDILDKKAKEKHESTRLKNKEQYQKRKLKKYQIYDPEEEKRLEQEAIKKALEEHEGKI